MVEKLSGWHEFRGRDMTENYSAINCEKGLMLTWDARQEGCALRQQSFENHFQSRRECTSPILQLIISAELLNYISHDDYTSALINSEQAGAQDNSLSAVTAITAERYLSQRITNYFTLVDYLIWIECENWMTELHSPIYKKASR